MGADSFCDRGRGKDAKDAFRKVTDEARYEHGHGGYSGTIAEKTSFVMITIPGVQGLPKAEWANKYIDKIMYEEMDPRIEDKWGPAGCIEIQPDDPKSKERHFVFFGYASS